MILSDIDLRTHIAKGRIVIEPFNESIIRENGVDLRLGNEIARLRRTSELLDTGLELDASKFYTIERGESFVIHPDERVLVTTLEYIKLPADIMGFVELRSTFARMGLSMPPTIIDAGFEGNLTLEVHGSSFPVRVYAGQRFAHVIFAKTSSLVERPYRGKYHCQRGVTLPRISDH